ncbi:MAG TPA: PDR/VanB family oxidoreductase [Kineosporiaceae bacterium]|nr:PDR/VanB family oxidoreductase [Kineosporiaceae bacterium]
MRGRLGQLRAPSRVASWQVLVGTSYSLTILTHQGIVDGATLSGTAKPLPCSRPGRSTMDVETMNLALKDSLEHSDAEFMVRIEAIRAEAEGVISLDLVRSDGGPLPSWQPGAHIDVCLPSGLIRQYSLCGEIAEFAETSEFAGTSQIVETSQFAETSQIVEPGKAVEAGGNRWRISVLDEPDGRGGSRQIHHACGAGDLLTVRGPRNHFPLVSAPGYLFIAGGIGVTPLLPMVSTVISRGADWRFLYGGRSRASMAFVEELAALGDRVAVRPQDTFGLLDLSQAISAVSAETAVYCCGPEPLISAVEETCARLGRPAPRVERFAAKPIDPAETRSDESFMVVIESTGLELKVGPDEAILEVLEANGVAVDSSCREGICGTCETPVRSGSIVHRDWVLTDDEKAAGDCLMVCVSRASTPRLVLGL